MASTYSPSLRLELIGDGDQSGIWGQTTNNNLGYLLEQSVAGVIAITMTDANYTLSNFNGVVDEARNQVLVMSGALTATRNVIAPLVEKTYTVKNSTTGSQSIQIIGSSGLGVTIPNGITALVYCDGTNFYNAISGSAGPFTVSGNLSVTGNETVTGTLGVTGATSLTTGTISGIVTAPTATAGTNTQQLATTAFVQQAGLVGQIAMWPTVSAPTGYLLCDGSAVSRTTYAALFAVVSTTFGAGDGSTTFNLPNYQGRTPLGVSSSYALASTGGSADAIVVSHSHTATSTDAGHTHSSPNNNFMVNWTSTYNGAFGVRADYGIPSADTAAATASGNASITTTVNTAGVSGTGANLSPYLAINFIIKT